MERRARRWCVMDLVTDHVTGKLRESYVWSNIGKGLAVYLAILFGARMIDHWEILAVLLTVIIFPKLAENVGQQIAMMRFGGAHAQSTVTTASETTTATASVSTDASSAPSKGRSGK